MAAKRASHPTRYIRRKFRETKASITPRSEPVPSSSTPISASAVDLLHEQIRRWIWEQGWTGLRDAQERAITPLLTTQRDVIIAAATASGKTEAAFLPILTRLAREEEGATLAIYISPLKALINDQFGRLSQLCERLDIPVIPWHGDITSTRKQQFLKRPHGVLLITPESLEAMFVRRGHEVGRLFSSTSHLVIDELHAFIGSDRGKQMQSILYRIEQAAGRRIPRVGLSATLGDMSLAAQYLRRGDADQVEMIINASSGMDLKLQVRGYEQPLVVDPDDGELLAEGSPLDDVADHLYRSLRGSNNLVFPNSRRMVEQVTDLLRRRCEADSVPQEFWPHHGSLSKGLREDTERALKAGDRPATGICTNTLELGIDIGAIRSVAQIGPGPSVASLRQRLGRSGRRKGEPAILRGYAIEQALMPESNLGDQLRENLVQQIAQIRLLMRGWFEPPRAAGLHLSTLVQQILSVVAERSGAHASMLHDSLVSHGAFSGIAPRDFASLLRSMASHDLLVQESGGLLLPGKKGEQLINHYDFYAAFVSEDEWTIENEGRVMGTLPISSPVTLEMRLIFGGRRWRVVNIDATANRVSVKSDPGGGPPKFSGGGPNTHQQVRAEMRAVLSGSDAVTFLDPIANRLLGEGRERYGALRLDKHLTITNGNDLHLLPWAGDDALLTLTLALKAHGIRAEHRGLTIDADSAESDALFDALESISTMPTEKLRLCLAAADNLSLGKWDWALPRDLLESNYASARLDFEGARDAARRIIEGASLAGTGP